MTARDGIVYAQTSNDGVLRPLPLSEHKSKRVVNVSLGQRNKMYHFDDEEFDTNGVNKFRTQITSNFNLSGELFGLFDTRDKIYIDDPDDFNNSFNLANSDDFVLNLEIRTFIRTINVDKNDNNDDDDVKTISITDSDDDDNIAKEPFKFPEYIPNEIKIHNPYHKESLQYCLYVNEPKAAIHCYWVCPQQYEHSQEIWTITTRELEKVASPKGWLNDTIINFMSRYMFSCWPDSFRKKVHLYDSWLFERIEKETNSKHLLRSTTKCKYIFDKEYLIMPRCANLHWILVIICHPGAVFDTKVNRHDRAPCILLFDSLNISNKQEICQVLYNWLNQHAIYYDYANNDDEVKSDEDDIFTEESMPAYDVPVPQQLNSWDCGCFMLQNMMEFGKKEGFNMSNKLNLNNLYSKCIMRNKILSIINSLSDEQQSAMLDKPVEYHEIDSTEQIRINEIVRFDNKNAQIFKIMDQTQKVTLTYPVTKQIQYRKSKIVPVKQIQVRKKKIFFNFFFLKLFQNRKGRNH